ncbi:recombinase family protein [Rossellomorea marisflavi]|uniref:recombinase family protein n=1 Tax=Rossellomorea marisflavi TaxID=189381 RepID=UPI00345DE182
MIYGYARVSSEGQNLSAQVSQLEDHKCEVIFKEKASGRTKEGREQFNKLLSTVQEGDKIVVTKLDRFARSTRDALNTIHELEEKGVAIVILNMGGESLDTSNRMGKLMVTMLSGIAEFELDMIKERQREGIEQAKKRGVYKGRPEKYTEKNTKLQHAFELYDNRDNNGYTVKKICEVTGISKATFHRKLKQRDSQ